MEFKESKGTCSSKSAVTQKCVYADSNDLAAELNEPVMTGSTEAQCLRVSLERLSHLIALSSELLTSHRRNETWQHSVEELLERLRERLADWQPIEKQLRMFIEEGLDSTKLGASFLHASEQRSQLKRISSNMEPRLLAPPIANTKSLKDMVLGVYCFLSVMKAEIRAIGETARLVDEEIRGLRMRPFSDASLGLKLVVRELSISTEALSRHAASVKQQIQQLDLGKSPNLTSIGKSRIVFASSPQENAYKDPLSLKVSA